ncbi:30S ribosome-binding factor RbfA [Hyphobacterium sp. CCMP332]|nr:30S ribosome-binding factor RbfA [Hyphobacterium sp. CCMP332]
MDSRRQNKVNRLLQKEISEFFQRNAHYGNGALITVTEVKITSDLSIARVYLSLIGTKNPQQVIDKVVEKTSSIRGEIGTLIRNQLRKIPEFHFFLDETAQYAQNISKIIDNLDIPPEDNES